MGDGCGVQRLPRARTLLRGAWILLLLSGCQSTRESRDFLDIAEAATDTLSYPSSPLGQWGPEHTPTLDRVLLATDAPYYDVEWQLKKDLLRDPEFSERAAALTTARRSDFAAELEEIAGEYLDHLRWLETNGLAKANERERRARELEEQRRVKQNAANCRRIAEAIRAYRS